MCELVVIAQLFDYFYYFNLFLHMFFNVQINIVAFGVTILNIHFPLHGLQSVYLGPRVWVLRKVVACNYPYFINKFMLLTLLI